MRTDGDSFSHRLNGDGNPTLPFPLQPTGSAIDGMTSFSYPLAQSYIADITEPAKLSQAYGLVQARTY